MMTITGPACLGFALNAPLDQVNLLLRIWVGVFGVLKIYVASVNRSPSKEARDD